LITLNVYNHPFLNTRAVAEHSEGKILPSLAIEDFESLPGKGLEATISGLKVGLFTFSSFEL
jgi:cation transport ATPase